MTGTPDFDDRKYKRVKASFLRAMKSMGVTYSHQNLNVYEWHWNHLVDWALEKGYIERVNGHVIFDDGVFEISLTSKGEEALTWADAPY